MSARKPALDPATVAAVGMFHRTGARDFSLRYSDDQQPVVWLAVVTYAGGLAEVDAALSPERAILRLLERLVDGGQCAHCGRMTQAEVDGEGAVMPSVCLLSYSPTDDRWVQACQARGTGVN